MTSAGNFCHYPNESYAADALTGYHTTQEDRINLAVSYDPIREREREREREHFHEME